LGTVRGTTADNISSSSLYSIPVMIPSLGKQDEFVETVKKVQQVKNEFKVSNSFLDNLFNSLLQKAFKGELNFFLRPKLPLGTAHI
jgi:type I restriction enzyme S subunit